ncbi:MAG: hypothetical protein AAF490_10720 [Chloroflexota bacterium]
MKSIHLVGSVPLNDSGEVFETLCHAIGPYLHRIPDGETGVRSGWIGFQHTMLESHPAVMLDPNGRKVPIRDLKGGVSRENHLFVINPAIDESEINFLPLGYAQAALDSFAIFQQKEAAGVIPPNMRFQVCLPTPFATGLLYFHPHAQIQYIHLMKQALLTEMLEICATIPHHKLAIQWDCCQEILLIEDYFPEDWSYDVANLLPTLGELGDAVPDGVELGFHLCYGSPVDEPLVVQEDMQVVVDFANQISASVKRSVQFMHLPVSDPLADDRFFAPLGQLKLPADTELYVGLVNPRDPEGDERRIQLAQKYYPNFGIATECGWGRKELAQMIPLLTEHQNAIEAMS